MPEAMIYQGNTGIIIPLVVVSLVLVALCSILGWKLHQKNKSVKFQAFNEGLESVSGGRHSVLYQNVPSNNEINQNKNIEIQMNDKIGDGVEANKSDNAMNNIE